MARRPFLFTLSTLLSFLMAVHTAGARETTELEDITVTANKTEESLQKVPTSLTVLTGETLEDANIESVVDIANLTPGLLITRNGVSGMNTPTMRGITAGIESFAIASGMYVDGVPFLFGAGFETLLDNVERVEILKGPQGTLYGNGTEAGVINIVTRKPDNTPQGNASLRLGTDDRRRLSLSASGPIVKDTLYMGFTAASDQKEGHISNTTTHTTADDQSNWSGRGQIRWTPTADTEVSWIGSRKEIDDDGPQMNLTAMGAAAYGIPAPTHATVSSEFPSWNKTTYDSHALKLETKLSETLGFTSVTTHSTYHDKSYIDWDFSSQPIFNSHKDNIYTTSTQEFRLNQKGEKLEWLFGLYGDIIKHDIDYTLYRMGTGTRTSTLQDGTSQAIFGQMTYAILEPLKLTTGLRYDRSEKEFKNRLTGLKLDHTWNEISPKAGLTWEFSDTHMAYITASKGFRTGGFNALARVPGHDFFDAETLWSYEVGSKNTFFNEKLSINGSLYLMKIDDIQVTEYVNASMGYVTNGAKATGHGGELEICVIPAKGLTISAGLSISDVEYDTYKAKIPDPNDNTKTVTADYSGNTAAYAPEYNANLTFQYRAPSGYYVRGDMVRNGKMYLDSSNTNSQKAYTLVNAKVGYETEAFDIYLYSTNLFDKNYDNDKYYGGMYTVYGLPREVGVSLAYRF